MHAVKKSKRNTRQLLDYVIWYSYWSTLLVHVIYEYAQKSNIDNDTVLLRVSQTELEASAREYNQMTLDIQNSFCLTKQYELVPEDHIEIEVR